MVFDAPAAVGIDGKGGDDDGLPGGNAGLLARLGDARDAVALHRELPEGGIDGDGDGAAEEFRRTDAEHAVGRDPQLAGVDGEQGRAQGILVGHARDPGKKIAHDIGTLRAEKLQADIALPLVVQILSQIGEVIVLDGEISGARILGHHQPRAAHAIDDVRLDHRLAQGLS